ncbi:hypothetical protein [Saccharopolyspora flava]|nr:hypothetical protein [Saccharopolyspora flava]
MGDHFQWIADVEVGESEEAETAEKLKRWLVDLGIIVPEETPCAISTPGHRPGSHFTRALEDGEVDADPAGMDGVEIHVGRTVFYPGQGEPGPAECPRCDRVFGDFDMESLEYEDDPQIRALIAAAQRWDEGGAAEVGCRVCGQSSHLNDWRWGYGALALGRVGLTFWNWPELSDDFTRQIGERLGHRVRHGLQQKL